MAAYTQRALTQVLTSAITIVNENGACFKTVNGKVVPVLDTNNSHVIVVMSNPTTPMQVYPDNTAMKYTTVGHHPLLVVGNTNAGAAILDSNGNQQTYTGWRYRQIVVPVGIETPNRYIVDSVKQYDKKFKRYIVDYTVKAIKLLYRRRLGRG